MRHFLIGIVALLGTISPALADLDTPQRVGEGNASGARVGAVPSPQQPIGATVLTPLSNILAIVTASPPGTVFYFTPGVYRIGGITPHAGDTYLGAASAILNGSTLLINWSGSAGNYTNAGVRPQVTGGGTCADGGNTCTFPQDVFFDGVPLKLVSAASQLTHGTYFLDYSGGGNGVVHLFDNPVGHVIETSRYTYAFQNSANNVTIKNLAITKYASAWQAGCVGGVNPTGSGWIIEWNEVSLCHGYGIAAATGATVDDNYVHDNGEMGIGGGSPNMTFRNNEVTYNNYANYDCANECGGMKLGAVSNTLVAGNRFSHNLGNGAQGVWFDVDTYQNTIIDNVAEFNTGAGIMYEISCNAVIARNTARHNASVASQDIFISSSHDVRIEDNTIVTDGGSTMQPMSQQRGSGANCGGWTVGNVVWSHNDATMLNITGNWLGGVYTDDSAQIAALYGPTGAGNRWIQNIYHVPSGHAGDALWLWGTATSCCTGHTFTAWQALTPAQDAAQTVPASIVLMGQ